MPAVVAPSSSHTLIVDDDPSFVAFMRILLDQDGIVSHDTDHAATVAEAEAALAEEPYDVVLLDLDLPDSHGRETLERVLAASGDTPVVVVTGTAEWDWRGVAIRSGAEDLAVKHGLEADILNRRVRDAVERRQLRLSLAEARDVAARERSLRETAWGAPTPPSSTDAALRDRAPEEFARLQFLLTDALRIMIRTRTHRTDEDRSALMATVVERLAAFRAGPHDVTDLYAAVLDGLVPRPRTHTGRELLAEGRMLALELMGMLVADYRAAVAGSHQIRAPR